MEGEQYYKITPPKYKSISVEKRGIRDTISILNKQYVSKTIEANQLKLQEAINYLDSIECYEYILNSGLYSLDGVESDSDFVNDQIAAIDTELEKFRSKLSNNEVTENTRNIYRKRIVELLEQRTSLEIEKNGISKHIDYIIVQRPKIEETDEKPFKVKKRKKAKIEMDIEVKETIPQGKTIEKKTRKASTKSKDEDTAKTPISSSGIRKILASSVLKFSSVTQCNDRKSERSKNYFITKDDLIKTIKDDPDLAKLFPKNISSFTKEKLCSILFPKDN
jgi:hypothetical protein